MRTSPKKSKWFAERRLNLINVTRKQDAILTRLRLEYAWHIRKHLVNETEPEPCIERGTATITKHLYIEMPKIEKGKNEIQHISVILAECLESEPTYDILQLNKTINANKIA